MRQTEVVRVSSHTDPMQIPNSPQELISSEAEGLLDEVFEDYEKFPESVKVVCRMMVDMSLKEKLTDATFFDMLQVIVQLWQARNEDRFKEAFESRPKQLEMCIRSAQLDAFLKALSSTLGGLPPPIGSAYSMTDE